MNLTRREFGRTVGVATVGMGILPLTSCAAANPLTDLQLVIAATETLVSVLASAGTIPQDVATKIDAYGEQVSTAAAFASTELASTDSQLIQYSKIAGEFAALVKPDLPAGIAQTILTALSAVASAVAKFLATVQVTSAKLKEQETKQKLTAKSVPVSAADKAKLEALHSRAVALQAKFKK